VALNWMLARDAKSGSWVARKQIPARLRPAYTAAFGKGWAEKFARPASLSEQEARVAFAEWLAEVEGRIHFVTAGLRGDGVDLSHIQAHALAGRWYRWKVARHQDDPGAADRWSGEIRALIAGLAGLAPKDAARGLSASGVATAPERLTELLDNLTETQGRVLDRLAAAALVPDFLAQERVILSAAGRRRFLAALVQELMAANALLVRRAKGDYSPDPRPARFPEWKAPAPTVGLTPMGLYQAWCKATEARTSISTRNRWISVFRDLERFWDGKDVTLLTEEDAIRWRDELRAGGDKPGGRTDKTVNFQYIAACKAVFGWAARPKTNDGGDLLPLNPFANFKFGKSAGSKKTTKLRERSFRLEEMSIILPAAAGIALGPRATVFAKSRRWVPWLLAYTGARPGEICQLRREDLRKVQDRWALRLTPEAGTIKDREARIVPIHDHLIKQGIVEFIQAQAEGPLFYEPERLRRTAKDDPSNPRRHPHEKVSVRLAGWVRELGVSDLNIKPNHAWRHTFKTRALVAGIDSVVADFICGHSPKTVGDGYYALEGDAGWPALTRAMDAFPIYKL
jgi:integrase